MNTTTICIMKTKKVISPELDELRKKIKSSLKARVRKVREDMNYQQSEVLAELARHGLDRTPGSVSQIENGSRLPSVEALYVLAKFLDTSTDHLLGLSASALSPRETEEELAAAKGQSQIDKILKGLPPEKQKQVLAYAEYLLVMLPIEQAERNKRLGAVAHLTEEELIDIEARKWLISIESVHGVETRIEIERAFRNRGIIINRAS